MDMSGKNVANAAVVATNLEKSNREVTATNDAGEFEFHAGFPRARATSSKSAARGSRRTSARR